MFNQSDTIAAISTPLGTGGVGIVRISGESSEKIISEIFSISLKEKKLPVFEANKIYHGWIASAEVRTPLLLTKCQEKEEELKDGYAGLEGCTSFSAAAGVKAQNCCGEQAKQGCNSFSNLTSIIDEVIVLCFKAPKSYTGEDLFEIQCHGGINVVKNILKLCLKSGARLAERGEFSKRAFINGKLDLSKAEAVLDLIHSKTDKFSQAAAGNLSGNLSKYINSIREELLELLSLITAAIDFPEEVPEPEYSFIEEKLNYFILKINDVLKTANSSNLMRDGLKVALAGKPNVGKSSLFNALLDEERAIVTEFSGTTRDIIQESIDIDGIPVILSDTAGIRELNIENSADYIESIGVNNSKSCIDSADVVLFVYDLTQGLQEEDKVILEEIKDKKVIFIGSKADLTNCSHSEEGQSPDVRISNTLRISAKEKTGLDLIKSEIKKLVVTEDVAEGFCTNARQQESLKNSRKSIEQALIACQSNEIQDLISIDLKAALISLGEITGEVVSDEIINNIFDNFCIGK